MYIVYFLVLMLLPLYAQRKVMKTYQRYAEVRSTSGMTGAEVARTILDSNGLSQVRVLETSGVLSDFYDPTNQTVNLSSQNYHNASVAGTAVAAHECGHAIQHKEAYAFLTFRSKLVPAANISSKPILDFHHDWYAKFINAIINACWYYTSSYWCTLPNSNIACRI